LFFQIILSNTLFILLLLVEEIDTPLRERLKVLFSGLRRSIGAKKVIFCIKAILSGK